ncbi:adenine-specific DNA methylase [Plakobranchus ocellatus]|uniref:Adenine-specific DNA methylase n=1 Tax=Plakobranchus ocellatus TaxID=259542 RepID=A0AAV4B8C9_9GAST|nr:adenine-specific DNA methylase [Plakobranchus ocellatus]
MSCRLEGAPRGLGSSASAGRAPANNGPAVQPFCVSARARVDTNRLRVQYSTVQYSTVQYSTVQYSTGQYSTVQYSTVQYSTAETETGYHINIHCMRCSLISCATVNNIYFS